MKSNISTLAVSVILSVALQCFASAQQDTSGILQRIQQSGDPETILIGKARALLLSDLRSGNIDEARRITAYVAANIQTNDFRAFTPYEWLLLCYWNGTYAPLYETDSVLFNPSEGRQVFPPHDRLWLELPQLTRTHGERLLTRMRTAVDSREHRDFLGMLFEWLTFDEQSAESKHTPRYEFLLHTLSPKADDFLTMYPDSRFAAFVRSYFRHSYSLSPFGFGLNIGLGAIMPEGTAGEYLKPNGALLVGAEMSYKDLLLRFDFDAGTAAEIRKPFMHSARSWQTGINHSHLLYSVSCGTPVWETPAIRLVPSLVVGGMEVSVVQDDRALVGGDLSMAQAYVGGGIAIDYKYSIAEPPPEPNMRSYSGVRFELQYLPFVSGDNIMRGGVVRLRVCWTLFSRPFTRDE